MTRLSRRPLVLIIRDGWGKNPFPQWDHANAVKLATHPVADRLLAEYPNVLIRTSGFDVGLPEGTMGNSEVGHQNIGAGRIVDQESVRITKAIRNGEFFDNLELNAAVTHARDSGTTLHLFGIVSDAGVHGLLEHLYGCLELCRRRGLKRVFLHAFTDGRDSSRNAGLEYIRQVEAKMKELGVGRIATVIGRYYAMDRDNRWERIAQAYALYTQAKGRTAASARAAIESAYALGEGDEFVQPVVVDPEGVVREGDAVLWLNFRPDRSRQITRAFMDAAFEGFPRDKLADLHWVCMTQYDKSFAGWPGLHVAYPPTAVADCLAEHLSKLGLTQFHTAETEKYAHVTYFLNGGREAPFPGEDRKLVPSPKVATYDLQPEMSAGPLTDEVLLALGSGGYDFVVVNYANPDMVGHTGRLEPTIRAVEFVDHCINRLTTVATELGFVTLITADHGNCEELCKVVDGRPGEPVTKHTLNPVPLILVNGGAGVKLQDGGALENVAPTLLDLMGLPIPEAMTARSLVKRTG
jgi:2,3-bisphosphoglycerate-independent phosphoglycerate mutase